MPSVRQTESQRFPVHPEPDPAPSFSLGSESVCTIFPWGCLDLVAQASSVRSCST